MKKKHKKTNEEYGVRFMNLDGRSRTKMTSVEKKIVIVCLFIVLLILYFTLDIKLDFRLRWKLQKRKKGGTSSSQGLPFGRGWIETNSPQWP